MKRLGFGLSLGLLIGTLALSSCASAQPYEVNSYFASDRLDALEGKTVAVLPFRGGAGETITDLTNLEFGRLNRYRLVERIRIQELYNEQDFDPERVDDETAAKIGRILGANAVVLGQVYEYTPGRASASMRLVHSETGEHLWQARDAIRATDARVRKLAEDRYDAKRLRKDPEALATVLVRALVQTVNR